MEHLLAYEFYYRDQTNQTQLIGILPERRKDLQRITKDSILNWAKKLLGDDWDMERIHFVEVAIDKETGGVFEAYQRLHRFEEEKE